MKDFCTGCKSYKEIVYVEEETSRSFCERCEHDLPLTPEQKALAFLMLTVPFKVGDRVECRTGAILYDGIGVVEEISTSLEHAGTPVYPSFRVRFEEKAYPEVPDELWYLEICLTKVRVDA